MTTITTSSSNITFYSETGGCNHEFDVPLYCEPHNYAHLWGWVCGVCWQQQAFYPDLERQCAEEVAA